eukprot:gene35624-46204_t
MMASHLNSLKRIGLTTKGLNATLEWQTSNRPIFLRFKAEEQCTFLRIEEREVDSNSKLVTKLQTDQGSSMWTSKVAAKVKEYYWKFDVKYDLIAFYGIDDQISDRVVLATKTASHEVKTSTESNPYTSSTVIDPIDVDLTWFLSHINQSNLSLNFNINRDNSKCFTPYRNPDVEAALKHCLEIRNWSRRVSAYMKDRLFRVPSGHGLDLNVLSTSTIFQPMLPLLVYNSDNQSSSSSSTVILDSSDVNKLLYEQMRSMQEKFDVLSKVFPPATSQTSLITMSEAALVLICSHLIDLAEQYDTAMISIEAMLTKQLIAAIGREVTPRDFSTYMTRFHSRKLFKEEFLPRPFCYSVRRSESHAPEGTISIEQTGEGGQGVSSSIQEPIHTVVHRNGYHHGRDQVIGQVGVEGVVDMYFSLSAATTVTIRGERYLHAWMSHRFSLAGSGGGASDNVDRLSLSCRARQFSSFIVLIGRIASSKEFVPNYAMIVQNKDEIDIPLEMEHIPSPKEFADAIESLSPEQQRFARAYRSMQLESTMFGVCVIQIKPQLETLLRLAPDSLTKEIKLTQDLMKLFVEFQIPSDLFSFDGDDVNASAAERLAVVKSHVNAILQMIEEAKQQEVAAAKQKAQFEEPIVPLMATAATFTSGEGMHGRFDNSGRRSDIRYKTNRDIPLMDDMSIPHQQQQQPPLQKAFRGRVETSETIVQSQSAGSPVKPTATDYSLNDNDKSDDTATTTAIPYTSIPTAIDSIFSRLDPTAAVRPSILSPGEVWTKKAQAALLASPTASILTRDNQKTERQRAFDLLDALTRSGANPVDHASLHVVLASSHSFDKTIMDTIVQENVNPIERVERSLLIMSSVIHRKNASEMVSEDQIDRLKLYSPMLFEE